MSLRLGKVILAFEVAETCAVPVDSLTAEFGDILVIRLLLVALNNRSIG